jgi:hypothetical protein
MTTMKKTVTVALAGVLGLAVVTVKLASAQEAGPPKLSSNPGHHVIFPAKGQSAEQQEKDQNDAYSWATKQTGWDPYMAHAELVKQGAASAETADATRGQAVKGAARGALVGVAVGAIAGDAGKGAAIGATAGGLTSGMKARQVRKGAEAGAQADTDAYQRQFELWDKHFVAAMEGKGYTVK